MVFTPRHRYSTHGITHGLNVDWAPASFRPGLETPILLLITGHRGKILEKETTCRSLIRRWFPTLSQGHVSTRVRPLGEPQTIIHRVRLVREVVAKQKSSHSGGRIVTYGLTDCVTASTADIRLVLEAKRILCHAGDLFFSQVFK